MWIIFKDYLQVTVDIFIQISLKFLFRQFNNALSYQKELNSVEKVKKIHTVGQIGLALGFFFGLIWYEQMYLPTLLFQNQPRV